jgi:DNA-directed RNA polymerase specialized sigma24 family protein
VICGVICSFWSIDGAALGCVAFLFKEGIEMEGSMLRERTERDELIERYVYVVDEVVRKYGAGRLEQDREELRSIAFEGLVVGVDGLLVSSARRQGRKDNPAGYLYRSMCHCIAAHFEGEKRKLQAVSLDRWYSEDGTLGDFLVAPDVVCGMSEREYPELYAALAELPEVQRDVLGMLFGLPGYGHYSRAETARKFGLHAFSLDYRRDKGLAFLRRRLAEVSR